MKRCRRCNNEVKNKDTYCPNCGLKLTLNSTYYSINHNQKLHVNNKNSNKKRGGCFFIALIIFYFMIFGITALTEIINEKKTDYEVHYDFESIDVNKYLVNTKIIVDDYYATWTKAIEKNISLTDIESFTSLKNYELTNFYCDLLETDFTIDNALYCVDYAHSDRGTYDAAYTDLENFYDVIVQNDFSSEIYSIFVDTYIEISNLLFLIDEYPNYNEFQESYNECINRIEILTNKLNNIDL